MGIVDKTLNFFHLRRIRNETPYTGAFKGAPSGSLWDWIVSPTTIDYQIRTNIFRLRQNARDLALNNPMVRQYLTLLAQNVIGANGMKLQAQVRNNPTPENPDGKLNDSINDKIEDAWADFWRSPFVDGRMSGIHGEQVLIKSVARDGEIFVRMIVDRTLNKYAFGLQIIDPDLIDHTYNRPGKDGQTEIRLGIEVDDYGRALAVYVWNCYPQDINSGVPHERTRIPAAEILHIYDPERANATRGVTWFNSVMASLRHLDGYVQAAVVAARTAACAFPVFESQPDGVVDENQKDFQVELNSGTGFSLPPGMKLANWNPNQPNTNFSEFLKGAIRFFCQGMHVSYNSQSSDLEAVNYSSIRSGLLIERDRWRVLQRWWADAFRQPVYEAWLAAALLSGALRLDSRDPAKFCCVKWIPRGWAWVDPLKDVNAAVIAIENKLDSRTRNLAEQGQDFEDILEELTDERDQIKDAGMDMVGAAVTAKDVTKETETEEGNNSTDAKALRRAMIAMLLDDEDVDRDRAQALLKVYRGGRG